MARYFQSFLASFGQKIKAIQRVNARLFDSDCLYFLNALQERER